MNIIEQTEALKDLPDQRLMQEMQAPTGFAPQFLVLSELKRRKRMRDEYQRQQAANMKTVAEEAVTAAGVPQEGIMQMSQAMNPNSSIAQNTGADQRPQMQPTQAPQMMADGGVVRMFDGGMSGGTMSAIANLKANYPDIYREAVQEGLVEQIAEYMQARAADAPYALDALEDPAPWFMKRPSQRSVDKKQLEIEESQPERALQARIDSRTALSRYGADDPIFGTSALEQRERPVTGQYTAAMDVPVTSVVRQPLQPNRRKGKVPLPSSDLLGSVPDMTERGVKTPSGSALSGLMPPVVDDGFGTESIQNMQEQERQDDIYKFLAETGEDFRKDFPSTAIADRLDEANLEGDEKYRKRILEGNLGAHTGLYFPEGSSGREVARKDLNLRALQFLQGDQFTPPSEIYSDILGGDPRAIAKYQEEPLSVIDQISDRLYREGQQGELAKQEQLFGDYDAEAQAQRDAEIAGQRDVLEQAALARAGERLKDQQPTEDLTGVAGAIQKGLDYVGDPALNYLEGAIGKFGELVESGQQKVGDYFDARRAMESDEANLGAGNQIIDPSQTAKAREDQRAAIQKAAQDRVDAEKAKAAKATKAAAAQAGSLEARIADAIAKREKRAEQDKWLALAQTGVILASGNPADLATAGTAGIKALTTARAQQDKFDVDMLGLQQRIDAYKARIAAAGKGGLTANQMLTRGTSLLKEGQTMLENAGDNADLVTEAQQLIDYGRSLIGIAMGGSGTSSGGNKTVKIS
jgi:hypothetical protein